MSDNLITTEIRIELGMIPSGKEEEFNADGLQTKECISQTQFTNLGDDMCLYGMTKDKMAISGKDAMNSTAVNMASINGNYLKDQLISFFQVSDNRLAMKLFGNKNALMREKMRQKAAGNWVIHPCSNFR